MKPLILYFTWDGKIEGLANRIAGRTAGDLFRICPTEEYPTDKLKLCARVSQELFDGIRPEYTGDIDISSYNTIFFGTPIWAHELPPVVTSFIERHDFNGKTVIPFCSCLSPLDATKVNKIADACKGSVAKNGYALIDKPLGFDYWLDARLQ